jgi:hypothetical protein
MGQINRLQIKLFTKTRSSASSNQRCSGKSQQLKAQRCSRNDHYRAYDDWLRLRTSDILLVRQALYR